MPIWLCQKRCISIKNVNKFTFACHVGFKHVVATIGVGHIYTHFDLLQGGSRSRNHALPMYTHIPNVISMVSCSCFVLFFTNSQNESEPFATRHAPLRSHSRSTVVHNVCRVPFRHQFSCVVATFQICYGPLLWARLFSRLPICVTSGARHVCVCVCVLLGRPDSKM